MDPSNAPDLTHCDDAAGALEKAIELNKVKTGEAPQRTIKIDERFTGSDSPKSPESDQTNGRKSVIYHESFGGKHLITVAECKGKLASDFSEWTKWRTLIIVWLVQISMNFNCSLYSNAIPGMAKEFNRSQDACRWGATVFLIAYAFGCELWAPWSEELGRFWVLQASLFLVNVFQFGVGFATNLETVIAFRTLGGLSTAGGSISLGMVADMWDKEHHQIPVAFVVFASVGGSVLGPIFGGFIEAYTSWKWAIWLQLLFGALVQFLHFIFVPETRATIRMDRIAVQKRAQAAKEGKPDFNLWGPNETPFLKRFSGREIFSTWLRPFKMFITEPIVLALSLLSGFSDALVFMFVQCFAVVYRQWDFSPTTIGLSFLPFLVGYLIAWISFIPAIARNKQKRKNNPGSERAQFENRLWWLLYLAPCLPIGLFGFAWTSGGPPIHWFASMVFTTLCGIANYAIYMATIDYMVTAYGPFSASATGGNGWARDFLAGILTPAALPYYNLPLGPKHIEIASTILGGIATILVGCVFVIYKYGPWLRHKSNFAQKLEAANKNPSTASVVGINYIPSGYSTAPGSARHSKECLSVTGEPPFHPLLNRTISQSTPDLLRSRVGFSRPVSPNHSRGCSRNTSPSGKKKRPGLASRSQSLYHDKAKAERDVTVDHSALLRSSRSKTPSPASSRKPAPGTPTAANSKPKAPESDSATKPNPIEPASNPSLFGPSTSTTTTNPPTITALDWAPSDPSTAHSRSFAAELEYQSLSGLCLSGVDTKPAPNAVQIRHGRSASVPPTAAVRSVEKEEKERADRG